MDAQEPPRALGASITGMSGSEPRGAGRGGGLLFLAILAFVAYLVLQALAGLAKLLAAAVLLVGIVALGVDVLRRR